MQARVDVLRRIYEWACLTVQLIRLACQARPETRCGARPCTVTKRWRTQRHIQCDSTWVRAM